MPKQPPLIAAKRAFIEAHRKAEALTANQQRLKQWAQRYTAHHGHPPVSNISHRALTQLGASA